MYNVAISENSAILPQLLSYTRKGVICAAIAAIVLSGWAADAVSTSSEIAVAARYVQPGKVCASPGDMCCMADRNGALLSPDQCDQLVAQVRETIEGLSYTPTGNDPLECNGILFSIAPNEPDEQNITAHVSPQKMKNYDRAHQYLHTQVFAKNLSEYTEEEILQALIQSHYLIMEGSEQRVEGKYRTQELFVAEEHVGKDVEGFVRELQSQGVSKPGIQAFRKAMNKLQAFYQKHEGLDGFLNTLNPVEKAVFSKVITLPLSAKKVDQAMKTFVTQLKQKIKQNEDSVELAAWVHQQLVAIHPFGNGNGRFSRLWMNAILSTAGYPFVYFPSQKEYSAEAKKIDGDGYKDFAKLLRKRIASQKRPVFDPEL